MIFFSFGKTPFHYVIIIIYYNLTSRVPIINQTIPKFLKHEFNLENLPEKTKEFHFCDSIEFDVMAFLLFPFGINSIDLHLHFQFQLHCIHFISTRIPNQP